MRSFARFLKAFLVWTLSFQMVFQSLLIEAHAQSITPDAAAAAANQSTVTTAPSGTPMVNIVAPNGAGVSHNKYTNFNVTSSGLILNNATALANTQLGGLINANPNLGGTAARLILDEVTSTNTSTLSGALEIGGTKADYILANPNGITCNGCGFINTARTTLTTGTPTFTANDLTGLSVNDGTVAIEGLGLDATTADKFDVVTRIAAINGQINAQDLGVYSGRQDFDYTNRTTVAKAHDGSAKPTFSIDSTALGGMYGGRITLVGTEAGVGVRFAADMAASAGDMTLTADGQLVMNANATATGNLTATSTASSVDVAKNVYAGGNASINAGTALNVAANASLGAAGNVTTSTATVTAGAGGKVVAGMDANGALTTAGTLNMTASTSIAPTNGIFGGGADVRMTAPIIDFSRAVDDNSESVRSRGTMTITTPSLTATNGRIAADGALTVTNLGALSVGAGKINSATSVTMSGTSVSTGATVVSDGPLAVTSSAGDITNTGSLSAGTTLALTSSANINNSGTLKSQTGTTLTAGTDITNAATKLITSGTNTTLIAGGALTNAGDIYAPQILTVTVPTLNNTGTLASSVNLAVNTQSFTNTAGVLYAKNNFIVGGYGGVTNAFLFDNASGVVETLDGDININASTIKNRKSVYTYSQRTSSGVVPQTFLYASGCKETSSGFCTYSYRADIRYSSPIGLLNFTKLKVWVRPGLGIGGSAYLLNSYIQSILTGDSAAGLISSGNNISFTGNTITNENSTITAVNDVTMTATNVNNTGTNLYNDLYIGGHAAGCRIGIGSTGSIRFWSQAVSGCATQPLALYDRQLVSSSKALIQAGGNLTITASGGVRSGTEQVYSTPAAHTTSIATGTLASTPKSSGIINPTAYLDLIPGRDTLFVKSVGAQPKFLYETRATFIDKGLYLGSDYFLSQFGDYDPEALPTRLGDAYFETQLIRQAILRETGQRWLTSSISSDVEQMKALLDGGLQAGKTLDLAFGITLTAEQITALTSNIIWYEDVWIDGRKVLVPKLYLASATQDTVRAAYDPKGAALKGNTVTVTANTFVNDKAIVQADGVVTITTQGDLTSNSAEITAGGDVGLTSTDGDVTITTQVDTATVDRGFGQGGTNVSSAQHGRSKVTSGGKLTIAANDNVIVKGADTSSGNETTITAGKDVSIGAIQLRDEQNYGAGNYRRSTTNKGSTMVAGGNVAVSAGQNIAVQGSTVVTAGDLNVTAENDITIESTQDTQDVFMQSKSKGGFLSTSKSSSFEKHVVTNQSSVVGAKGDVNLVAKSGDLKIIGSAINGGKDVTLSAQEVDLNSATDIDITKSSYSEKGFGFSSGSGSISLGKVNVEIKSSRDARTQVVSSVTSGGNLSITATKNIDSEAATLAARGDVVMTAGENVNISSVQDTLEIHQSSKVKSAGLTLSARENITGSVKTILQTPKRLKQGQGNAANKALTAATAILEAAGAANTLTGGNLVEAGLSLGASSSTSSFDLNVKTARVGQVDAGNDVAIKAGQDLTLQGTQVTAGRDATLDAGRDLTIVAAQSTFNAKSRSKSSSASVGVSVGVGLMGVSYGVNASASTSKSKRVEDNLTHTNALVQAGRDVALKSGQDTKILGADVVAGGDLTVGTGRDLTVVSKQDTGRIQGSSSSFSISASASTNPVQNTSGTSNSIGFTSGSESGSRQFTENQTPLIAGGDVTVTTGNHTQLDGAVIASTGGDVAIDTNTFGFKDLADTDTYTNTSGGVTLSASTSTDSKGQTSNSNNATLSYAKATRDKQGITRATVAAPNGNTTITIRANPAQGLDGLNQTLAKAQEITRNEQTNVRVVIDTATVKEVMAGLPTVTNAIEQLGNELQAITTFLPDDLKHLGQANEDSLKHLIRNGVDPAMAEKLLRNQSYSSLISAAKDLELKINESGLNTSDVLPTKGISYAADGTLSITILGGTPKPSAVLVTLLADSADVISELPTEEATAAIFGLQLALGGPIKTLVQFGLGAGVDEVFGNKIEAVKQDLTNKLVAARLNTSTTYVEENAEVLDVDILGTRFGVELVMALGTGSIFKAARKLNIRKKEISLVRQRTNVVREDAAYVNLRLKNEGYTKPPYDPKHAVYSFKTGTNEKFLRFYAEGKPNSSMSGSWMMRESDVIGLSAQQIKNKFALEHLPTHKVDVTVPKGVTMDTGIAGPINGWGAGGMTQFQITKTFSKLGEFDALFSNPRKF